ncbi:MAG: O-methyltransferase [Chitinophagia bacterium]|nr:O-methyltransferase [Chitinophagia bacterium]
MSKLLLPKAIDQYARQHTSPENSVLAALNRATHLQTDKPVMLSGHLQGAFLQMWSHAQKPMTVLELGTFTGYSAICLAQGIPDGGVLHTIDNNEELYDMVQEYTAQATLQNVIKTHIGNVVDILPTIPGNFDLVFIDADKVNYALYYDMLIDRINIGGYLIADNVLYEGDVTLPEAEQGKNAKAMHQFNQKITADPRVQNLLLPLRDGLMIMRKIG